MRLVKKIALFTGGLLLLAILVPGLYAIMMAGEGYRRPHQKGQ